MEISLRNPSSAWATAAVVLLAAVSILVYRIIRLRKKLKDKDIGIVITDHNVHETLSITDRAYLLFEGSVLKAGTAEELAADPLVKKVYLGTNFELRR